MIKNKNVGQVGVCPHCKSNHIEFVLSSNGRANVVIEDGAPVIGDDINWNLADLSVDGFYCDECGEYFDSPVVMDFSLLDDCLLAADGSRILSEDGEPICVS